jgi:hypothetical protein
MRSMDGISERSETIRVNAPVGDPELGIITEVMSAAPDPADPDQAVLLNAPFLVDGLNFGDLVRLGPDDECGVRPIVEVVTASGHVHLMAATEPGDAHLLAAELERTYPGYAIRIEGAYARMLSVSIHPDLDPHDVAGTIAAWLAIDPEADPDSEDGLALSPVFDTQVGPIEWPSRSA